MYTRISRSGGRSYLQIVEGFRTPAGVRQRVVANLGRLELIDGKKLDPLIHGLQRALGRVPELGGLVTVGAVRPLLVVEMPPAFDEYLGLGAVAATPSSAANRVSG